MTFQSIVLYRLSDYPDHPHVCIRAELPINLDQLRTYIRDLREVTFPGMHVRIKITAVHPETGGAFEFAEDDLDEDGPFFGTPAPVAAR